MNLEIEVGQTIAGKYDLVRLLGRGAMGEVWLARHKTLGEEVAIKFLRPEEENGEDAALALGRFLFEAQVAARLSRKSRHIVQVTDHGDEGGVAYLVMQRLEGESLEARIERGRLSFPLTKQIVAQVARGLAQAHVEAVFHRDLKPANIYLTSDEDGKLLVKILDFGIARAMRKGRKNSPTSTARGVVLGTPSYMSPEQARGFANLDHRCDLWALAVVAYEALTGTIPFPGETTEDIFLSLCMYSVIPIHQRRPDLGPEVDQFFQRAFAKSIADRFSTADELAEAFASLVPGEAEDALPAPAPSHEGGATQAKLAVTMSALPLARGRVFGALAACAATIAVGVGIKVLVSTRGAAPVPTMPESAPAVTQPYAPPESAPLPRVPNPPPVALVPTASVAPRASEARAVQRPVFPARTATSAAARSSPQPPSPPATFPASTLSPNPPPTPPPTPPPSAKPVNKSEVL